MIGGRDRDRTCDFCRVKSRTADSARLVTGVWPGRSWNFASRSGPLVTAVVRWPMPQVCPKGTCPAHQQHLRRMPILPALGCWPTWWRLPVSLRWFRRGPGDGGPSRGAPAPAGRPLAPAGPRGRWRPQLHPDRQDVGGPVQRQADRRLSGHVERDGVSHLDNRAGDRPQRVVRLGGVLAKRRWWLRDRRGDQHIPALGPPVLYPRRVLVHRIQGGDELGPADRAAQLRHRPGRRLHVLGREGPTKQLAHQSRCSAVQVP
jgi:hypothetical protein